MKHDRDHVIGSEAPPPIVEGQELSEVIDLISTIGNHEAKALTLLYLNQQARHMTRYDLGYGLIDFVGSFAWRPNPSVPFDYCANSFEPIGQVVKSRVETSRGMQTAYAISDKGKEIGVPLAGYVLDWSLRYPDISVQSIFGPTYSTGATRAPQTRTELLMRLVQSSETSLPISDLAGIRQEDSGTPEYRRYLKLFGNSVKALERGGIVRTEKLFDDGNTRNFIIVSTERSQRALQSPHGPVLEGIYVFLEKRSKTGKESFTYNDCLESTLNWVSQQSIDVDPAEVRRGVTTILMSSRSKKDKSYYIEGADGRFYRYLPGIKRLDTYSPRKKSKTKISLNEEHKEALVELTELLQAFAKPDEAFLRKGKRLASSIVNQEEAIKALMNKAAKFSPFAGIEAVGRMAIQSSRIVSILEDSDSPLDVEGITTRYVEKFDKSISPQAIGRILRELVAVQKVDAAAARRDSSRKMQRKYYSLMKS